MYVARLREKEKGAGASQKEKEKFNKRGGCWRHGRQKYGREKERKESIHHNGGGLE